MLALAYELFPHLAQLSLPESPRPFSVESAGSKESLA